MSIALLAAAFICASPGITDGDTIRCQDGTRVRLWGIQAPERHDPGGPDATRALAKIIASKPLRCTPAGRSYNRVVARCFIGKRDVAGEMVRQGFAVDWPRYSGGAYRSRP